MTLAEQAAAAIRAVREEPIIGFDTEGTGLDWRVNKVVGYVITVDADHNYYIPVRHGGGGNLHDPNVPPMTTPTDDTPIHWFEVELAEAFRERQRRGFLTVLHHAKFDMHFSANHGIIIGRNISDTQNNGALLNEYSRSFSLANLARDAGVTPKLGDELYQHISRTLGIPLPPQAHKIMEHYWRLAGNDEIGNDYAKGDGITTLELYRYQVAKIEEEEMQQVYRVECELVYTLFRMERRGIKADMRYIDDLAAAIDQELASARSALPDGYNPRSGPQTRKVMEDAGETNWPLTEKGSPSFTEQFLKKSAVGRSIIAVRQLANLNSTFVEPLRNTHIFKGRVHAVLNQMKSDDKGTVSGRLSCSDPNLQAIHKRNKVLGRRFRAIFVADDGYEFYEADYSQCEPRLFAHYSGEPALVEGYNMSPPRDMHAVVADMFNVERDPTAKRMNMGILTGMQPKTFAGHMDWPLTKATEMFNQWFRGFPGIKAFQDKAKARFRNTGYVMTLLGRRCHLDNPQFAYKGTSRVIQGGNADVIKYKLVEIDKYLESEGDIVHLLMTVHDSINWQAPKTEEGRRISARIVEIATAVQCEPFNLRVPFIMDVGSGPNWAIATYGELKEAA